MYKRQLEGLAAHYGSILSSEVENALPLGGTGRFIGLTPNDEVNALAAAHFAALFERANVYQSASGARSADDARKDLRGRTLFHEDWPLSKLDSAIRSGSVVKTTNLTEEFTFEDFLARYGEDALPIGVFEDGRLELFTADRAPNPAPDAMLLSLVSESGTAEPADRRQAGTSSATNVALP